MIAPAVLVILALGALGASLALLAARLDLPAVADGLVGGAALCGLTAFAAVARSTIERARRLPSRGPRP
jgi:hypothetical protein